MRHKKSFFSAVRVARGGGGLNPQFFSAAKEIEMLKLLPFSFFRLCFCVYFVKNFATKRVLLKLWKTFYKLPKKCPREVGVKQISFVVQF